jgi:hypothetical protein
MVRSGAVPPPELVAREYAERSQSGRRPTAKEWPADWYGRRHGTDGDGEGDGVVAEPQLGEEERRRVRRLVEERPSASAPEIMGAAGLPPEVRPAVESVVSDSGGGAGR